MKKEYSKPCLMTIIIQQTTHLLQGSGVHTDDPQTPGSALSRENDSWWDDEEE